MRKQLSLFLFFFILLVAGNGFAKSYFSALRSATESKEWFSADDLKANVVWNATYFSDKFRKAFIQEHIKRTYLDEREATLFTKEQEDDHAKYTEFFFGLYAKKPYRELSLSPASFWELILTTENGEVLKPVAIEVIKPTPYDQVMFPYLDRWSKGYRVKFPKVDQGDSFTLTLRSVIGQVSQKWHQ